MASASSSSGISVSFAPWVLGIISWGMWCQRTCVLVEYWIYLSGSVVIQHGLCSTGLYRGMRILWESRVTWRKVFLLRQCQSCCSLLRFRSCWTAVVPFIILQNIQEAILDIDRTLFNWVVAEAGGELVFTKCIRTFDLEKFDVIRIWRSIGSAGIVKPYAIAKDRSKMPL